MPTQLQVGGGMALYMYRAVVFCQSAKSFIMSFGGTYCYLLASIVVPQFLDTAYGLDFFL